MRIRCCFRFEPLCTICCTIIHSEYTHSCSGTGGNKKEDKGVGATEVNFVNIRATLFVIFTYTFNIHIFLIFTCEYSTGGGGVNLILL